MDKTTEALRAVIDAARKWAHAEGRDEVEDTQEALQDAVKNFEDLLKGQEPNKPTGFVLTRPWSLVPAGWFVRVPNGEWFEVLSTFLQNGKQNVTLRSPAGKRGTFPRVPGDEVKVRRGTHTTILSDAIEALSDVFGGTAIVKDDPPWDE